MKAVIFYFSGTGNTWWVSTQLKEGLEKRSCSVDMYSLENSVLRENNFVLEAIENADHVIIGFPIYGSAMPLNMREFVANLPTPSKPRPFAAFCTQAAFSGDGGVYFKKEVEAKGYEFRQSYQFNLTTNFNVAMFPFSFSKPAQGKKLEKIKKKAVAKVQEMATNIVSGTPRVEGRRFYQILIGGLQRHFFLKNEKKMIGKFSFLKDKCVKCGLCVKSCPTNSLTLDEEIPNLQRDDNCLLCFRCYNFCPTLAINYGGKVKNPEKYKRFKGPVESLTLSDIRK